MIINQYLVSRNYQQQTVNRNNLELFKNLLQPHFLFNSPNNLYALSLRKSDQTSEAIAGLSQLLERVVSYSRQEMILLSEEIGLIENAFIHGIRKCDNNGWITIHLVVKDDKILLKVRNSVQASEHPEPYTSDTNAGLGIEAVRKLLDDSFRKKYSLDARAIGNVYAVDLIIGRVAA